MPRSSRSFFAGLVLLASAIFAGFVHYIAEPIAAAFNAVVDYFATAMRDLTNTDSLSLADGPADLLRWSGGEPLDRALQNDLEHDRHHLHRSAKRNC